MSGNGVWHPAGCRCLGCLPRPFIMAPASPARNRSVRPPNTTRRPRTVTSRPVHRGPGSARPANSSSATALGLAAAFLGAVLLWPLLAWHGDSGPGGTEWQWNGNTTIACSIWWGIVLAGTWACAEAGKRSKKRRLNPPMRAVPQRPLCAHRDAEPVWTLATPLGDRELVAWWCLDCETQLEVKP